MRVPRELPRTLSAELAEELICRARSARDKAILALLLGSGQRIGDWPDIDGRHGVLGMCALWRSPTVACAGQPMRSGGFPLKPASVPLTTPCG